MYTYPFEKLAVWYDAKELAKSIYSLTSAFPSAEKYGLISQLRRASISNCSNLSEGSARSTKKDQAHFTTLAFSSAMEVINQLIISKELGYIDHGVYRECRRKIEPLTNKLNALRNSQINR
jgi:four helix bundle protein